MKTRLILVLAMFGITFLSEAQDRNHIWFDQPVPPDPAPMWEVSGKQKHLVWENNSLPLGNGSLGASVLSSVSVERIILNEKTLWTGGPGVNEDPAYYWNVNKESHPYLPQIRQAFIDGNRALAGKLTAEHFNGIADYKDPGNSTINEPFRFGHYTVAGELRIRTGSDEEAEEFRRGLSLDSAYSYVTFTRKNHAYSRKAFVSYPDNVLVIRFEADTEQVLEFEYLPNPHLQGTFSREKDGILFTGRLDDNGMEYALRAAVCLREGNFEVDDHGRIQVRSKGPVDFLVTADTDYRINPDPDFTDKATYVGEKPMKTTARWISKASRAGYAELNRRHSEDYTELFSRVELAINPGMEPLPDRPMPQRLADYKAGMPDHQLETMYLQFGRYLLISSSRKGNLPANLQGIWADDVDGPWHVDYHNNINVQMNYWPACPGGLPECEQPYLDYIRTLVKPGSRTAAAYYDAEGWTASISANIFGFSSPVSQKDMRWNLIPVAGPWLAIDVWNYYDYTRDSRFLRKYGYDLISGSARFVSDLLWKRPDGKYVVAPSTSPEHGNVDCGTSFSHAVCRELLADAVKASELLGRDEKEREEWKHLMENIVPYQIGRYGQIMEWSEDIDDPKDEHRHVNHLFGLHPGNIISPYHTPELAEAAKVVLNHRGDGATGWSMGWKLNLWARLLDGDRAYRLFGNLLRSGTRENLWCAHPPFQIDGNFGGAAGVMEMLMQSHAGFIDLLPALPQVWKSGHVSGIRARGNFSVAIDWQDNQLQEAAVLSLSGAECVVRYKGMEVRTLTEKGKEYRFGLVAGKLALLH